MSSLSRAQDGEELEQLADIQLEHFVKAHGSNLGQYVTEHDCACGAKLYIDGHNPEKANLYVVQAHHIAEAILAWHTRQLETKVREARIDARRKLLNKLTRTYNPKIAEPIKGSPMELTNEAIWYNKFVDDINKFVEIEWNKTDRMVALRQQDTAGVEGEK